MALASSSLLTLSPNLETLGWGWTTLYPNIHDIEDKRFSLPEKNRYTFGAAVQAAGTCHFGLLSAWALNQPSRLPNTNMAIPGWRLQCFSESALCCCAHMQIFPSCSRSSRLCQAFPSPSTPSWPRRLSGQNQLAKGLILPHLVAVLEARATTASDAPIEALFNQQGFQTGQTQYLGM